MFPVLLEKDVTTPSNNGFGMLSDCIDCKITEVLNGDYSLEMTYPLDGLHAEEITTGRLLYALRDNQGNRQLFRIAEVDRDYLARTVNVFARHISYDLESYYIPAYARPDTAYGWLEYLQDCDFEGVTCPFTFTGDITASDTTRADRMERHPRTVRGLLLTDTDAIIDTYAPTVEFEFDNFTVNFLKARGTTSSVTVRYGHNLTSFEGKETSEGLYYAFVPYFKYDVNEVPQYIYGGMFTLSTYDDTDPTKRAMLYFDCTEEACDELGLETGTEPTALERADILQFMVTQRTVWVPKYLSENVRRSGVTINFQYLADVGAAYSWDGAEPERNTADLGDYVTVYYPDTGESRTSEIVTVVYDCLKERYDEITAGQLRATLSQTIKQIAK